jgi:chromosomal replication initiator protein
LPRPSIAAIQALVCARLGVPLNDIRSPRRNGAVLDARHIAMWLARREWLNSISTKEGRRYSSMAIGLEFGDRHHSTVLAAVKRIDRLMASDRVFARRIDALAAAVDRMAAEQQAVRDA